MLIAGVKDAGIRRGAIKNLAKARESSTSEGLFPKLVGDSGGSPIIKERLLAIFHWKDHTPGEMRDRMGAQEDRFFCAVFLGSGPLLLAK